MYTKSSRSFDMYEYTKKLCIQISQSGAQYDVDEKRVELLCKFQHFLVYFYWSKKKK